MPDGLSATFGQGSAGLPQNFELAAGAGLILKITVFDEAGSPVPLAGTQAIVWRLGRDARSAAVLSKALANGVTIITDQAGAGEPNCGRVNVTITLAESAGLAGEYLHECRLTDAAGQVARIFYGRGYVARALPEMEP